MWTNNTDWAEDLFCMYSLRFRKRNFSVAAMWTREGLPAAELLEGAVDWRVVSPHCFEHWQWHANEVCSVNHGWRGIWPQSIVKANCQEELRAELSRVSICIPLLEYLNPERSSEQNQCFEVSQFHLACGSFCHVPAVSDRHFFSFYNCSSTRRNSQAASKTRCYSQKTDCWKCGNAASTFAKATSQLLFDHQGVSYTTLTFVTHFWTAHCIFQTHTTVRALWCSYKSRTAKGCKFKYAQTKKKKHKPSTVVDVKTKRINSYKIWWYNYCVGNRAENEGPTLIKFN